jgi:hypothetical protein
MVENWQGQINRKHLQRFKQTLAQWHRQFNFTNRDCRILTGISWKKRRLAMLIDGHQGTWLFARAYRPSRPGALLRELHRIISPEDEQGSTLFAEADFLKALQVEFPSLTIREFSEEVIARLPEENRPVAEQMAGRNRLEADLSFLTLPASFNITPALDLALSVAAQGLLRVFARKLPGFASSSLPYLYHNFLDFSASLEEEPERRVIRLSPPPLQLVLNMTGMTRSSYRLSWLDEKPFALFQEEG